MDTQKFPCLGALIGDTVRSVYEFDNIKTTDFQPLFDEIRPYYEWEESCQGTVPPALLAFFDSHDFEESIRLAVSLGGDSDTLACITGGIAQAYYKEIPDEIIEEMRMRLPKEFWDVMEKLVRI